VELSPEVEPNYLRNNLLVVAELILLAESIALRAMALTTMDHQQGTVVIPATVDRLLWWLAVRLVDPLVVEDQLKSKHPLIVPN